MLICAIPLDMHPVHALILDHELNTRNSPQVVKKLNAFLLFSNNLGYWKTRLSSNTKTQPLVT